MAKETNNILSLDSKGAIDFFLKSDQYHGFELPEYFVFDDLLHKVRDVVGDTPYEECLKDGVSAEQVDDVNLDILLNKDGHYAVRPIILANPFLYYFLVREICCEEAWPQVQSLFKHFQVPHLTSCALPVIPAKKEAFHKSTTILNWWNSMEQRSIELSLEYRYMFVTDITNCYGSINPQTFDWVFSLKGTQYEKATVNPIAKNIQKYLCALQHGRNIGIPQGSAIFDFVAEIILGYSDLLLHEAIQRKGITAKYEIIRYRDDYRIFCEEKDALVEISYILQQVLEHLNFRMNSNKTKISESIITDSIKSDKLAYIYNTPIFNKKGCDFDSFEKHLLYILMFSREYPDSGSMKTLLSDIDKRMEEWLAPAKYELTKVEDVNFDEQGLSDLASELNELQEQGGLEKLVGDADNNNVVNIFDNLPIYHSKKSLPGGSVRAMSAICAQIAIENVGCCHYALRIISRMIDSLNDGDEKWAIINLVNSKLRNQPNSEYNQLWLQNMTYQQDKKNGTSSYDMRLCRVVAGDDDVVLWNNEWLKESIADSLSVKSIIDQDVLKKVTPVITFRERRQYDECVC